MQTLHIDYSSSPRNSPGAEPQRRSFTDPEGDAEPTELAKGALHAAGAVPSRGEGGGVQSAVRQADRTEGKQRGSCV